MLSSFVLFPLYGFGIIIWLASHMHFKTAMSAPSPFLERIYSLAAVSLMQAALQIRSRLHVTIFRPTLFPVLAVRTVLLPHSLRPLYRLQALLLLLSLCLLVVPFLLPVSFTNRIRKEWKNRGRDQVKIRLIPFVGGVNSPFLAKFNGTYWSRLGLGVNSTNGKIPVNAMVISGPELFVAGNLAYAGMFSSFSIIFSRCCFL